ncbi:MAG: glycosyltransferase family 39 protein [Acidobacteria bacterium]|uniref:Glycosyltransferase family 39 protein n=1 Tax=Candidatus Polarisedimenticola svalbardensis TaxID=2886004 RepID=A0A8J6Y1W8_9BACT|nr:glycosyltransferase family 39 protein [Candidatus Polarisedimenticola svalbardensis]
MSPFLLSPATIKPTMNLYKSQAAPLDWRLLTLIPGLKLLLHILVAGRYGYFRDELYFLDCARNLDWGYVDCAPLIGYYGKVALLLGGSLTAVRIIPAVAGAGLVLLTMLLARRMGGNPFAQALAGLCIVAAPIRLAIDGLLSMNAFEPLFWTGCIYLLIRIIRTGNSRLWIGFGVLAGLGLMNKHSTLLFGFAVLVALIFSGERRELRKRWIWLGGLVAGLIFLPNIIWQITHDFPTLEGLRNVAETGKNVQLNPLDFILQQVLLHNPLLLPVWVAGLVWLLAGKGRRLRMVGWIFLTLTATMIALKAKHYYLAPIFPMMFAAGAVAIEGWLFQRPKIRFKLWPKALILLYVLAAGAIIAPAILPFMPPEQLVAYQERIGLAPSKTEVAHVGPLEQRLGDQFGWEELVADVAFVYNSLPLQERARTGIYASNYGEAGALNQFGPAYGLPAPICAHQNHYFWGPPERDPDNLIWLQWSKEGVQWYCKEVEQVGEHFHPWGMAEENRPIYLCRGLKQPLSEIWDDLKHWN